MAEQAAVRAQAREDRLAAEAAQAARAADEAALAQQVLDAIEEREQLLGLLPATLDLLKGHKVRWQP